MIFPILSQTHLFFNYTHLSIWLMSGFSRWRPFYLQSVLWSGPFLGYWHWVLCLAQEVASWPLALASLKWPPWQSLVVSDPWFIKGQRLWNFTCHTWWWQSLISLWVSWACGTLFCKSLVEPGTRDHLFSVPQDRGLRCMFSLDNIRQYLKKQFLLHQWKKRNCACQKPHPLRYLSMSCLA